MSEDPDHWRKQVKPQTIPVERNWGLDENASTRRFIRIKGTKYLGSGTSGVVRELEAELLRRPRFLNNPVGWFFPKTRALRGFAIKVMRPGTVGEALESYQECKDAGLTVPRTYKYIGLRDGRAAILTTDLRKDGYVIAQSRSSVSRPDAPMQEIANFDDLLQTVFFETLLASRRKTYGKLLGGDALFFLMPRSGGIGRVKHIFADFERMHNQEDYNSTRLEPFRGNAALYKKEVTKINIETIQKNFQDFIEGFVAENVQNDYASRLESHVRELTNSI
jgi:hypothetical protein